MVKRFCAFLFGVTKTLFQIRRLKHVAYPFSPHHPPQQFTPPRFQEARGDTDMEISITLTKN